MLRRIVFLVQVKEMKAEVQAVKLFNLHLFASKRMNSINSFMNGREKQKKKPTHQPQDMNLFAFHFK